MHGVHLTTQLTLGGERLLIISRIIIRKYNLSPQSRCDLSGLSVNVGESQITQCLGVIYDLFVNFYDPITAHIFILETLAKIGICYRSMLVLLLFMHLLVVD